MFPILYLIYNAYSLVNMKDKFCIYMDNNVLIGDTCHLQILVAKGPLFVRKLSGANQEYLGTLGKKSP